MAAHLPGGRKRVNAWSGQRLRYADFCKAFAAVPGDAARGTKHIEPQHPHRSAHDTAHRLPAQSEEAQAGRTSFRMDQNRCWTAENQVSPQGSGGLDVRLRYRCVQSHPRFTLQEKPRREAAKVSQLPAMPQRIQQKQTKGDSSTSCPVDIEKSGPRARVTALFDAKRIRAKDRPCRSPRPLPTSSAYVIGARLPDPPPPHVRISTGLREPRVDDQPMTVLVITWPRYARPLAAEARIELTRPETAGFNSTPTNQRVQQVVVFFTAFQGEVLA